MSVGFVLGWDVSMSTELSWDSVVVGAGKLSHGAAAVGWASAIRCRKAISCAWAWLVRCGDKVERGGGHGQWLRGLFAVYRRVGSTVMNAPSCSSGYRPKIAMSLCVLCVCV